MRLTAEGTFDNQLIDERDAVPGTLARVGHFDEPVPVEDLRADLLMTDWRRSVIRTTSLAVAVTLLLAACSAVPGTNPTAAVDPGTEATPAAPNGGATTNPDDPLGFGNEANTAVVTIGDQRYEFGNLFCVALGGAMGAVSVGGDPTVDIDLPPMDWQTSGDDWGPPGIEVDDGDLSWIADPEDTSLIRIEPGLSQVDSYSSDGFHATGTATFMEATAWNAVQIGVSEEAPEPVQGTFEVTCPRR